MMLIEMILAWVTWLMNLWNNDQINFNNFLSTLNEPMSKYEWDVDLEDIEESIDVAYRDVYKGTDYTTMHKDKQVSS